MARKTDESWQVPHEIIDPESVGWRLSTKAIIACISTIVIGTVGVTLAWSAMQASQAEQNKQTRQIGDKLDAFIIECKKDRSASITLLDEYEFWDSFHKENGGLIPPLIMPRIKEIYRANHP